jgi:hypothetical protein
LSRYAQVRDHVALLQTLFVSKFSEPVVNSSQTFRDDLTRILKAVFPRAFVAPVDQSVAQVEQLRAVRKAVPCAKTAVSFAFQLKLTQG